MKQYLILLIYKNALSIMEACFGSDHPEVAQSYNALAWICMLSLSFMLVSNMLWVERDQQITVKRAIKSQKCSIGAVLTFARDI